ncbi:hypothetical protein GALL_545230 [mine drainage metagenome]|uniref:Uncharacterized protein n=1 Tax=mine drainage metagenome TaxID=410659 RepID=A0A1J5PFA2_9ZZZZ
MPVARAELRRRRIKIVKRIDIDPHCRHRDDQVGKAEPKRREVRDLIFPIRQFLAHQIRPGHAQMNPPRRQLARDFARRQQHQADALRPVHDAGIFPLIAVAAHLDPTRAEPLKGLFHQPPLGRHPDLEAHARPSVSCATSPGRITPPTAGIDRPCPSTRVSAS